MNVKKILLVEDNPINQALAKAILAQLGYTCDIAETGSKAIEYYKLNLIDYKAVILDLGLPDMNGFNVLSEIKHISQLANIQIKIPIIVLTAQETEKIREKSFELGANIFITKPLTTQKLTDSLNEITKKQDRN